MPPVSSWHAVADDLDERPPLGIWRRSDLEPAPPVEHKRSWKLSAEQRAQIVERLRSGNRLVDIARDFGISKQAVLDIRRRHIGPSRRLHVTQSPSAKPPRSAAGALPAGARVRQMLMQAAMEALAPHVADLTAAGWPIEASLHAGPEFTGIRLEVSLEALVRAVSQGN